MEALLGGELHHTLRENSLYGKVDHARYFLACALMGVHHLHQLHVVLRSLKPEEGMCRWHPCGTDVMSHVKCNISNIE